MRRVRWTRAHARIISGMNAGAVGVLDGEGFRLRVLAEEDAELLVAASRSDVPDWTFIPRDLGEDDARAWIRRRVSARERGDAIRFVIEHEGKAAGTIGAEHPYAHDPGIVETFYFLLPEHRGRGLATRALLLLHEWLRDAAPTLRRLQLHAIVGNPGSERVAERAGYLREGVTAHQIPPVNGYGPRDAVAYGIALDPREQVESVGVLA